MSITYVSVFQNILDKNTWDKENPNVDIKTENVKQTSRITT